MKPSQAALETQRWVEQKRAALERAAALRAERQASRSAAELAARPPDPSDRHLPNCTCELCAQLRERAPAPLPLAPSALGRGNASPTGGGICGKPEWNSDFTDECRGGFESFAEQRRKEERMAKRRQQQGRLSRGRSAGPTMQRVPKRVTEHLGEQSNEKRSGQDAACVSSNRYAAAGVGEGMTHSGSALGLRAIIVPSSRADEGPATRINFDKRTSRHMHAKHFIAAVSDFRKRAPPAPPAAFGDRVQCFLRKRPLFPHESEVGEYDVVTVLGRWVVVHVFNMAPDLQRMRVTHSHFPCAEAFGERATNDEIHEAAMLPLVKHALSGGRSTCLMYGATGSGKTYTMTAMQQRSVLHLCANGPIGLTMLEIAGKEVHDLLAPSVAQAAPSVALRENREGELDMVGARSCTCTGEEQLAQALAEGQQRRKTCGTLMNASSSRSHMVCLLSLAGGGSLVLVDCAGSERKEDSARHTTERQREGADINSSLLALKECIRALTAGARHVPFRMHNLTRVLRDSFTRPDAKLHVVATVAPGANDAEHSVATLRMACSLCERCDEEHESKEEVRSVQPSRERRDRAQRADKDCREIATVGQGLRDASFAVEKNSTVVTRDMLADLDANDGHRVSASVDRQPPKGRPGKKDRPPVAPSSASRKENPSATRKDARTDIRRSHSACPEVSDAGLVHPSKWTLEELLAWLQQQRLRANLPQATDVRTALRWNVKRWTEACGGDERAGLKAFNGLRLEMDRIANEEKRRRKQIMTGR